MPLKENILFFICNKQECQVHLDDMGCGINDNMNRSLFFVFFAVYIAISLQVSL